MPLGKVSFLYFIFFIGMLPFLVSGCSSPDARGQEDTPVEPFVAEENGAGDFLLKGRFAVVNPEMSVFDLSMEERGEAVLFSSTARTVNLLDGVGSLQWSLSLDDLPVQAKLNPSATSVAVGTSTGEIFYLNENGEKLWEQQLQGSTRLLSLSSGGKYLSVSSEEEEEEKHYLYLLNEMGRIIWVHNTEKVSAVFVSERGNVFLSEKTETGSRLLSYDRYARLRWELDGLTLSHMDEKAGLLVALQDNKLTLLNSSGQILWSKKTPAELNNARLSRGGERVLAYGSFSDGGNNLFCYDLEGELSWQKRIPEGSLVEISAEGTRAVVASWQQYSEDYTQVMVIGAGGEIEKKLEITSRIEKIALSRDGDSLALAGGDGNIYILDLEAGGEALALETNPVYYRPVSFQRPESESPVLLYFFDSESKELIPVTRNIRETSSLLQETINELIKGPRRRSELTRIIPKEAAVGVSIDEGAAYLDLPEELDKITSANQAEAILKSLVLTSSQFPSVRSIHFLVEGERVETFSEANLEINKPFPVQRPTAGTALLYVPYRSGVRYYLLQQESEENRRSPAGKELVEDLLRKGGTIFPRRLAVLDVDLSRDEVIIKLNKAFKEIFPEEKKEEDIARVSVILDAIFLTLAENLAPDKISITVEGNWQPPEGYPSLEREITRPYFLNPE